MTTLAVGDSPGVLSLSPIEADHEALEEILADAGVRVSRARTLAAASAALEGAQQAVLVCEAELQWGSWRDVLAEIEHVCNAPLLIVTSVHADDRLWAEALNIGAYDVIAKPFCGSEAARVIGHAVSRWQEQNMRVPSRAAARAARILVVDDNAGVRTLVCEVLRRAGYEVVEADGALAALSFLERPNFAIDLMITDVHMPGIDGTMLAGMAREKHPACRVLLMSGGLEACEVPYPFLAKPFNCSILVERVKVELGGLNVGAGYGIRTRVNQLGRLTPDH